MTFWIALQYILNSLYVIAGLSLFIYNRKSIIIANRRPKMVVAEAMICTLNLMDSVVSSDSETVNSANGNKISCEFYQCAISVSVIISYSLMISRMTFVYNYLMKKEALSNYGLILLCNLIWDDRNKLKIKSQLILIASLVLMSWSNIFGFDLVTQQTYPDLNKCSGLTGSMLFLSMFNILTFLLFLAFSIQFVRYRIIDQLWMSVEFVMFTFTVVIVYTGYHITVNYTNYYDVMILSWISLFYILYFPLFVLWRHNSIRKRTISKASLINNRVMELCRQFYCEENGIFLESYEKFRQNLVTSDYLVTMFIEDGAPFELNITYALKTNVINNMDSQRDQYLGEVYAEIKLLVQQNILPYLENESGA